MKNQCKCGGNLEKIAVTQVGIAAGYMARRSVFSECGECKSLYETAEKVMFQNYGVGVTSSTFQYGGTLKNEEIKKYAHYQQGHVSREDEKEIVRLYRK